MGPPAKYSDSGNGLKVLNFAFERKSRPSQISLAQRNASEVQCSFGGFWCNSQYLSLSASRLFTNQTMWFPLPSTNSTERHTGGGGGGETEWKEKTGPGHTVTVCVSLCWRFESKSEVSLKGGRFEEKRFLHLKKEQIVLGSPSELSVTVTNQVQTEQMRSFRRCSPRKKTPTLPASPVDHLCASRLTSCCPPTSPLPGNKRQHTRAVS